MKRISIKCFSIIDGTKEKVYFHQDCFVNDSCTFDFESVRRVLKILFPACTFVSFICSD